MDLSLRGLARQSKESIAREPLLTLSAFQLFIHVLDV